MTTVALPSSPEDEADTKETTAEEEEHGEDDAEDETQEGIGGETKIFVTSGDGIFAWRWGRVDGREVTACLRD